MRPKRRMRRKREAITREGVSKFVFNEIGSGSSRTISMSKTKKITAKRKNRRENGSRAFFLGSKPHSNGENFSRSLKDRAERERVTISNRIGNKEAEIIATEERSIASEVGPSLN